MSEAPMSAVNPFIAVLRGSRSFSGAAASVLRAGAGRGGASDCSLCTCAIHAIQSPWAPGVSR
ncbi:MAG: hypothetical protein ACXWBQ_13365 [Usitatibacter sp.]